MTPHVIGVMNFNQSINNYGVRISTLDNFSNAMGQPHLQREYLLIYANVQRPGLGHGTETTVPAAFY